MFVEEKTQGEPAKVMDEPSKLLLKAAAALEDGGWTQGTLTAMDGSVCAVGAVYKVGGEKTDQIEAFQRLGLAISGLRGGCGIAKWNDTPGRTKDEVVSKLRAVALGL